MKEIDSKLDDDKQLLESTRHIPAEVPLFDGLTITNCIGEGHFSQVFKGKFSGKDVAVKLIERFDPKRVLAEVVILKELEDCPHIINLLKYHDDTENPLLVFNYYDSLTQNQFYMRLTRPRFRLTLRSILQALQFAKTKNIVHRDIKLGNILTTPHWTDIKIIDWGSATFVNDNMSPHAGSRAVRPPEMLLGYRKYGFGCDTWAIGIFILHTLTEGNNPFKASSSTEALIKISEYFGAESIINLAQNLEIELNTEFVEQLSKDKIKDFKDLITDHMKATVFNDNLYSLMIDLLSVDPAKRSSVDLALKHRFFRKKVPKKEE